MKHVIHQENKVGRDFVVGDLHGCYNALLLKLHEVLFDFENDRLFSVGDLVDRGKQNLECLVLLKEPWFHAVKGNHEQMMCDYVLRGGDYSHWLNNGGQWYDDCKTNKGLRELIKLADELPYARTVRTSIGTVGITHANPPDDWRDLDKEHPLPRFMQMGFEERLIWSRAKIQKKDVRRVQGVDFTVHGHTPLKHVVGLGNSLFIDTGAVYSGKLTLLLMQDVPEWLKVRCIS